MVPYASLAYADHLLRLCKADPNEKATGEENQINTLIEAAKKFKDLMASMETQEEIKGYITYKEDEKKEEQLSESKGEKTEDVSASL